MSLHECLPACNIPGCASISFLCVFTCVCKFARSCAWVKESMSRSVGHKSPFGRTPTDTDFRQRRLRSPRQSSVPEGSRRQGVAAARPECAPTRASPNSRAGEAGRDHLSDPESGRRRTPLLTCLCVCLCVYVRVYANSPTCILRWKSAYPSSRGHRKPEAIALVHMLLY